jgi:DNA invertase Pin-like site-specific DNA recombinase
LSPTVLKYTGNLNLFLSMQQTLAYLRTSTDKQDLNNQKLEILEYARKNSLHIDDFIAIAISSRKDRRARRIEELLKKLKSGDTLIVTELSRLGRSTGEVISLIDELIANDITILILKQHLQLDKQQDDIQSITMITMLSLFAQMERSMISRRTKEALAAKKAQGIVLGKPKGTIQRTQFDAERERIVELLRLGVSIRKIALQHLRLAEPSSLHYYVRTRHLLEEAAQRLG